MATVNDWTTSAYPGNYGNANENTDRFSIKKRYFDCASTGMDSAAHYKIFYVAANSVIKTHAVTATIEGGTDTLDVCFIASTDTTAASPTTLINDHDLETDDTCNAGTEIFTDVAGYITVLPNAALAVCAFYVVAEILPVSTDD